MEDILKADGCPTARAGTRGAQCVYVPYVQSAIHPNRSTKQECGKRQRRWKNARFATQVSLIMAKMAVVA